MENLLLNLNKNQTKVYNRTMLWLNNNRLHVKYKEDSMTCDLDSITSVSMTKNKSKSYKTYTITITFIFVLSYVFFFNWYVLGLHSIIYIFSYLYFNQYKYYFVILTNNKSFKIEVDPIDRFIFKEFLKDFNYKKNRISNNNI